ncbi:hypothetical protein ACFXA8_33475, partial [Streptomyces sp. NPDC059409]
SVGGPGVLFYPVGAGGVRGGGEPPGPVPGRVRGPDAPAAAAGWSDRPELARACRLSMAIGMLAMLLPL